MREILVPVPFLKSENSQRRISQKGHKYTGFWPKRYFLSKKISFYYILKKYLTTPLLLYI